MALSLVLANSKVSSHTALRGTHLCRFSSALPLSARHKLRLPNVHVGGVWSFRCCLNESLVMGSGPDLEVVCNLKYVASVTLRSLSMASSVPFEGGQVFGIYVLENVTPGWVASGRCFCQ